MLTRSCVHFEEHSPHFDRHCGLDDFIRGESKNVHFTLHRLKTNKNHVRVVKAAVVSILLCTSSRRFGICLSFLFCILVKITVHGSIMIYLRVVYTKYFKLTFCAIMIAKYYITIIL